MPLTPHIALTALAALLVLAAGATVVHRITRTCRRLDVAHDLALTRALVASGQFGAASRAYGRAERAHRPRMALEDTDVTLLALGPMSLLEPQPFRPVIERGDPTGIVATAVLRSVVR